MKKHVYAFDYIRAIAAMGVVLFHYTTRYNQIYAHIDQNYLDFPWGYMGVTTFFVLSAFLSTANMKDGLSPKRWVGNRVVRLIPIYWISMVITFCSTKLLLPDRSVSFPAFIVNLTMLNDLFGIESVDGAYWTLRYEVTLYLIIFLLLLLKKEDKIKETFGIWLAIAIVLDIVSRITFVPHFLINVILSQYIGAFVIGAIMGTIYRTQKYSIIDLLMVLVSVIYFGLKNGFQYTIYLVLITVIFLMITLNKSIQAWKAPGFIHDILMFFAGVSYPLYLIHQNIGYIIIGRIEMKEMQSSISICIALLTAVLLAYLLDRVDKQILNPLFKRTIERKLE